MIKAPLLALLLSLPLAAADYDHIHLAAPDPPTAVQWYQKHFGGKPTGFRGALGPDVPIDRIYINGGDIPVIFSKRKPGEGSVGSGVDHIGFSFPNVAEIVEAVTADGGSSAGELREFQGMKLGFVTDPWGTKIEIIDDPALRGVHHVHLSSADPEAALDWYVNVFGGKRDKFGGVLSAVNYGNLWVLARKSDQPIAPTQGRSLDHIGFAVPVLDDAATELKGKGVHFSMEPRDLRLGVRISMVQGPDDVRIEVLQP